MYTAVRLSQKCLKSFYNDIEKKYKYFMESEVRICKGIKA